MVQSYGVIMKQTMHHSQFITYNKSAKCPRVHAITSLLHFKQTSMHIAQMFNVESSYQRTTQTSKQLNRTVVHMYMAPYQSTEGGSVNVRHSLHNWYNVCSVLWALWMALPIWCTDFTLQVHNCKKIQIAALTFDSHDTSGLPLNQPQGFSLVTNCFAIYHIHTPQVHNHTLFIRLWARFDTRFTFFCYGCTNLRTCTCRRTGVLCFIP